MLSESVTPDGVLNDDDYSYGEDGEADADDGDDDCDDRAFQDGGNVADEWWRVVPMIMMVMVSEIMVMQMMWCWR